MAASGSATSVEGDPTEPTLLGAELAKRLLGTGARDLLDRAEKWTPPTCLTSRPYGGTKSGTPWGDGMSARAGVVYLVGAGPGDPGLMTARALELIGSVDAIYHDRLIPPGALDGAREDAELVYVGKAPGKPSVPQEEIGERLIEAAEPARASCG